MTGRSGRGERANVVFCESIKVAEKESVVEGRVPVCHLKGPVVVCFSDKRAHCGLCFKAQAARAAAGPGAGVSRRIPRN